MRWLPYRPPSASPLGRARSGGETSGSRTPPKTPEWHLLVQTVTSRTRIVVLLPGHPRLTPLLAHSILRSEARLLNESSCKHSNPPCPLANVGPGAVVSTAAEVIMGSRGTARLAEPAVAEWAGRLAPILAEVELQFAPRLQRIDLMQEARARIYGAAIERIDACQRRIAHARHSTARPVVALIGRTMAGKSTLREALTCGTGSTIGKGRQSTTRRVRRYRWNGWDIVDAPGVAAADENFRPVHEALARGAAESADVIAFVLSSDSIQESVLDWVAEVHGEGKPVLFALNFKYDLTKAPFRRRFLKEGGLASPRVQNEVCGHAARLRRFGADRLRLGQDDIALVPIHAQAAFLGRHHANEEESRLHAESGLARVEKELNDLARHGTARLRAQAVGGGIRKELNELRGTLLAERALLKEQRSLLEPSIAATELWLREHCAKRLAAIPSEVTARLARLRKDVSRFVDDNIEASDVRKRWGHRVEDENLSLWMKEWKTSEIEAIGARLEEVARQLRADADFDFDVGGIDPADDLNWKRVLGWTSAGASSVLLLSGLLNLWNPAGWVMGALGALAIVSSFFAWLSESKEERLAKRRRVASDQLRAAIVAMEAKLAEELESWVREHLAGALIERVCSSNRDLLDALSALDGGLEETIVRINRSGSASPA